MAADYLRLPVRHRSGRGMTAGGSLSPLLAAATGTIELARLMAAVAVAYIAGQTVMDTWGE